MNQKNQKEDPRFAQALYDPRFHNMRKKNYKTKIDNRFNKIFTDKEKFEGAQNLYEKPDLEREEQIEEQEKEQSIQQNEEDVQDNKSEEDKIPRNENSSNRLAMQNFDWRYLKSKEIYTIFSSFVQILYPDQDVKKYLKKVDLYLSDFGQQQLDIEQREGPKAVLQEAFQEDDQGNKEFNQKLIRKYELDRLKYYFAVITFENKFCAERIYDNYDGYEIELSGCRLDLRFLPKELKIEKKPNETCKELKQDEIKRLPNFITQSVGHSQVELTWENQNNRNLQHLFQNDLENINEQQLKEVIESEDDQVQDQENFEEMRAKLLGNNNTIFNDFKKNNQQDDLDIKFQVGFGEEGFNLDDDSDEEEIQQQQKKPSKQKLSKKQFLKNVRQKKIEKRKRKLEQDKLNLLVDQKEETTTEINLNDPRFNKIYDDSNFAVDPTHTKYNTSQGKRIQAQKKKRRKFQNEKKINKQLQQLINGQLLNLRIITARVRKI